MILKSLRLCLYLILQGEICKCKCKEQIKKFIYRVCTHLDCPWKSLNLRLKIQGLESPWKLLSMLESPWISVLTLSNPKEKKQTDDIQVKIAHVVEKLKKT